MIKADYWQFPHSMIGVSALLEVASQHGLSIVRCLQGTALSLDQIGNPQAFVTPEQEFTVTRNVLHLLPASMPLSIEVAQRMQLIRFGIWGLAILNAKTFSEAVLTGLRFIRLGTAYCHIAPTLSASEAYLKLDNRYLPPDLQPFFAERDAIMLINIQLALNAQTLVPTALRFTHSAPPYAAQFAQSIGIAAQFDQPEHGVAINPLALHSPIPASNLALREYCIAQCQQLLQQHDSARRVTDQVQRYLTANLPDLPSLETTAQHFNLHPRTLKRHLQQEHSNFSTLVMDIKGQLAQEFLRHTDFALDKIAEQLGYAELSSFSRAFKNWHGISPQRYRMSQSR